jgi:hypothetical protein
MSFSPYMGNSAQKASKSVLKAAQAAVVSPTTGASDSTKGAFEAAERAQRVMRSGPRVGPAVHEKSNASLERLGEFRGAIVDRPDDGIGAKNFSLWQAMQLVRVLPVEVPRCHTNTHTHTHTQTDTHCVHCRPYAEPTPS